MEATKMDGYRQILVALRDRLKDDIDRRVQALPEDIFKPGFESSIPTHIADEDTEGVFEEIVLGGNQENIRHQIQEALERIDEGTYGRCADCSLDIAEERLEAIPYTPYCIDCERRHESE